jgi:pimeloyl-ACP methyl ester carboxylesterase
MADTPDTIVLVHGFGVTPRSWEHWIDHDQGKGFRVLAPAYPGYTDPTPIDEVTVPAVIGHLEAVVADLVA